MRTQILKSLLTLFIVSTFFYSHAQEQGTKELTLGYGVASTNAIVDVLANDFILPAFTGGNYKTKNQTYSGASYINFSYAIKNDFLIGAEVVYERISKDIYSGTTNDGRQIDNSFTIGANAKYSYISNSKFFFLFDLQELLRIPIHSWLISAVLNPSYILIIFMFI